MLSNRSRLILGSQSPRRKEILNYFAIPFVQIPSAFKEETVPYSGDPAKYVAELSLLKGKELAARFSEDVILTADTVVFFKEKIYNKPKDFGDAFAMLRDLSGNWHTVLTGVTIHAEGKVYSGYEETKILFNPLTDEQIHLYHRSSTFLDKAGGYALQGAGSILVSRIEGSHDNVVGLPINTTKDLLLQAGIDLWKHLKPF